jgi:hypothetical protein
MRTESTYRPPSDRLDRTKLAALIDGRLAGAERDAVLTRLAASPTDLEIVADALAVSAELDEDVTDIRQAAARRASRRPRVVAWASIAAAVVVVASLPMMLRFAASPSGDYAALLTGHSALAAGWEAHSWSATRGAADDITERSRGIRVGALTSTLDVAVARRDSAAPRLAEQIAELLINVPGAREVATTYRTIAAHGLSVSPDEMRSASRAARGMVAAQAFDDGAWLEAARIAATDRDATFFAAAASRAPMSDLEHEAANDARIREDVAALRQLIGRRDWDALSSATANILAQLAAR